MSQNRNQNTAIILAAGKGTRMKSAQPKVLHAIACEPMLTHVIRAAQQAGCSQQVIVTSPDMPEVADYVRANQPDARIALQDKQLGTGHAVLAAKHEAGQIDGAAIVLFGDSPLITAATIEAMGQTLLADDSLACVVLGFEVENPPAYGRLVMEQNGELLQIVEAKDASPQQLAINWCNGGVMAIRGALLWSMLEQLSDDNAQGEYYLTDLIAIARKMGHRCAVHAGSQTEALGVNSRAQLAQVEALMQTRLREKAMASGVSMIAPETVFLCADTAFGKDVLVEPNVFIGTGVQIDDNVHIKAFSHLEGTRIAASASVGPFARLRPGAQIGQACKIGNFVEIKKATLASGAKVSHLSYIGDASVGENANIGAGTITCNYDGYRKYQTSIGADVFVGSNSALVAPVQIGARAIIGAGSVITDDVPQDALALARGRQSCKDGWAKGFANRMKDEASE